MSYELARTPWPKLGPSWPRPCCQERLYRLLQQGSTGNPELLRGSPVLLGGGILCHTVPFELVFARVRLLQRRSFSHR